MADGGVLSGPEIARLRAIHSIDGSRFGSPPVPSLEIEPFDPARCGPNSYDVSLSDQLRVYALASVRRAHPELFRGTPHEDAPLSDGYDFRRPPATVDAVIGPDGMWLVPGVLYLGATVERTCCHGLVPWLDGRSSVGRGGLSVHVTAGRGDDAWPGRWTCEITAVAHPVKVYPNMRFGQVTFFTLVGERKPYAGKYAEQDGPTESRLHLDQDAK